MAYLNGRKIAFAPVVNITQDGGGYDAGFADGKQAQYDAFWDAYQDNGNRVDHRYAFGGCGWVDETFKPKYAMRPTIADNMFAYAKMTDIKKSLADAGVVIDFSQCTSFTNLVVGCASTTLGEINTVSANTLQYLFSQRNYLVYIDKIILREDGSQTGITTGFQELRDIVEIRFEGKFGQDVNFQRSTKLSKASIESIIAALSSTATGQTVTFSAAAVDKAFETREGANDGQTSDDWLNFAVNTHWGVTLV